MLLLLFITVFLCQNIYCLLFFFLSFQLSRTHFGHNFQSEESGFLSFHLALESLFSDPMIPRTQRSFCAREADFVESGIWSDLIRRLLYIYSGAQSFVMDLRPTVFFLFWTSLLLQMNDLTGHKVYTNTWAVHIPGGPAVADRIAKKHSFINHGQVSN